MEVKPGYKHTEVGVIPREWIEATVGALVYAEVIEKPLDGNHGNIHPKSADFVDWGIPFVMANNVQNGRVDLENCSFIKKQQADSLQKGFSTTGDVLLTHKATIGNTAIVGDIPFPYVMLTPQVTYYRVKDKNRLSNLYLRYFFDSAGFQTVLRVLAGGGTRSYIGISAQHHLPVILPPTLTEQCAIATALSHMDALLDGLDRLIAKKRAIKQATMQQLLTGQTRLPGFSGEWEVKRLGDLAHIKTGNRNNEDKVEDGKYPFFVRSDDIERINSHSYDCEAILVPGEGRIGEIFHYINGKFDVHQRVYAITQFSSDVSGRFVHLYLSANFGAWAMQNTVKATVDSLRLPTFLSFQMCVPPTVEEQIAIATVLNDVDAEITALETRRTKTRALKQAMMQELLTGRIRLVMPASESSGKVVNISAGKAKAKAHNWQINEAVVISVLASRFGSELYPLGRKRCTKLAYLMHRYVEYVAEGFRKKAAGPYNPDVKYRGPEGIAQKNGYIRQHRNGQFSGFVADQNIAQAEAYFMDWYGQEVLDWLEQFRKKTNDELELLTTVDMSVEDLERKGSVISLESVKTLITEHPEWKPKLERPIFSDINIKWAIDQSRALFAERE